MKKLIFLSLMLLLLSPIFNAYEVGDVVADFSWQDSDGGTPVQRSLHQLTASNKIVLIAFGSTTCPACNTGTPGLQDLWTAIGDLNFHLVQTMSNVNNWDNLNGATWRYKFDPPLTYWLAIGSELHTPQYWNFGNGYIPYYIVIDKDNVLRLSGNNRPTQQFIENLIMEMDLPPAYMYRFFNTVRGGHLYTISEIERDYILEHLPEWSYEGPKFMVYSALKAGSTPTYRFFNTITGIHLYTISEYERDTVMQLPEWNYEGIKYYVNADFAAGTIPVYRFFNHVHGGHLYTISEIERDAVMQLPEWTYEGVPFYVLPL